MKDVVKTAGIFKGNYFFQQRSIFTRLKLAECEATHSLKDHRPSEEKARMRTRTELKTQISAGKLLDYCEDIFM